MNESLKLGTIRVWDIAGILLIILLIAGIVWVNDNGKLSAISWLGKNPILLEHSNLSHQQIMTGQSAVFTATLKNDSKSEHRLLIDIEIMDENNTSVSQRYWDNVLIKPGRSVTYEIETPARLPAGTYKVWVGVFEPGWGRLRFSEHAEEFTIQNHPPSESLTSFALAPAMQR